MRLINWLRTRLPVMTGRTDSAAEYWRADHPVLEVLRSRRSAGSRPGLRAASDKAKVGLAVEGGGMRGIVSAAMLQVVEECGLTECFDVVYGCSSGAVNCAYFLAGETWYPLSIYFHDLTTRQFIDFRRAFKRGNILNLDYAFEEIVAMRKPLAYDRVLASDVPLKVAVTDVDAMETQLVSGFADAADLKAALIASSWLPIAVRGTVEFRGRRAIDGGVLTALPFRLALADGCTHVLSLSTRPMGSPANGLSAMHRYTCAYLERLQAGLGRKYLAAVRQKHRDLAELAVDRLAGPGSGRCVLDLAPLPGSPEIKRHEIRLGPLVDAATSAAEIMYCAIEGIPVAATHTHAVRAVPRIIIVDKAKELPGADRIAR